MNKSELKHSFGTLLKSCNIDITETSPYKSDPRFPPNIIIVKMGEIRGRNQNDKNGYFQYFSIKSYVVDVY